jgi:hypothetical protein
MSGYTSLFNASTAFSDAELASALPDFQSQVSNEFNYYWGINSYIDISGYGTPIIIVDYPGPNDPPDALGYHYIDGNYQPYAIVFAGLCRDYGYATTGVISHELLELLADQLVDTVNLYDFGDGTGIIVIQEVCDPVEMSLYYEAPNGNIVSDFALPGWWAPGYPYQVDFLGVLGGPWQLASGGYISYQNVTLSGWQQASAEKAQQDLSKIADLLRLHHSSVGNPRIDLVRQLQLQRGRAGAAQAMPSGQGMVAGQIARPVQAAGRVLANGKQAMERRQQTARRAGQMTVVKRQDVPVLGQAGQDVGEHRERQAHAQAQQPSAAGVGQATSGPKAQLVRPKA